MLKKYRVVECLLKINARQRLLSANGFANAKAPTTCVFSSLLLNKKRRTLLRNSYGYFRQYKRIAKFRYPLLFALQNTRLCTAKYSVVNQHYGQIIKFTKASNSQIKKELRRENLSSFSLLKNGYGFPICLRQKCEVWHFSLPC